MQGGHFIMTRKILLSIVKIGNSPKDNVYIDFENHTKHLDHKNHYNQIIKPGC